ncbi:MAG: hypothetical protein B1H09_07860 [Gemmatimonadaceae bacterium 4484_173]|nr:MAG: hypothetical protein B1H09_07860 [Gemmatimonadaceae bacterium 4484_173]RKZ03249.1 MAG: hypothetical protein DRQ21_06285 [Candidatus Fermentibacteria bacterium]
MEDRSVQEAPFKISFSLQREVQSGAVHKTWRLEFLSNRRCSQYSALRRFKNTGVDPVKNAASCGSAFK